MRKIYLIIALLFCTTLSFAQQKPTKEYKEELKSLVEITGGLEAYKQGVKQIATITNANATSEQLQKISDYVLPKLENAVVEIMAPMYIEAGITIDDIKSIKAVYLTEAGKKFVAAQTKILTNAQSVSQQLAMKIQELIKEAPNQ